MACNQTTPNQFKKIFSLDLRSLALFRMGLAVSLLYDLYDRAHSLTAHYTRQGILPKTFFQQNLEEPYLWSLHLFHDAPWYQTLLFILATIFALALLVGYRTRIVTLISWILLCSLQIRNPLILQFGDVVLRLLLFWSLFLPLGAYFSLDRLAARNAFKIPKQIFSGGSIALLLQMAFIYWFTAALKSGPDWWKDGTAVYYALNFETLAKPLGLWLGQFPQLLTLLTYATMGLEMVGPLLIFSPWWSGPLRTLVVLAFLLFHLGLVLTLHLGIFPLVCMVGWLAILPPWFWEKILPHSMHRPQFLNRWQSFLKTRPLKIQSRPWTHALALFLIVYVLVWNIRTVQFEWIASWFPYSLNRIGEVLRLEQRWGMYVPQPRKTGGWYVIPGVLENEKVVDVFRNGKPVSWEKPNNVAKELKNDRWGNYLTRIWDEDFSQYRSSYAQYLCREWNQQENSALASLQIYQQQQVTPNPGEQAVVTKVLLYKHHCADDGKTK